MGKSESCFQTSYLENNNKITKYTGGAKEGTYIDLVGWLII